MGEEGWHHADVLFQAYSVAMLNLLGGELNKLASNISQARDIAGVHWSTDATEANKLGEAVAISILKDMRALYNEPFHGFSLTKFDDTTITVSDQASDIPLKICCRRSLNNLGGWLQPHWASIEFRPLKLDKHSRMIYHSNE